MDEELISREEVTEYLFAVLDMRNDLRKIRLVVEGGDDGEAPEADS